MTTLWNPYAGHLCNHVTLYPDLVFYDDSKTTVCGITDLLCCKQWWMIDVINFSWTNKVDYKTWLSSEFETQFQREVYIYQIILIIQCKVSCTKTSLIRSTDRHRLVTDRQTDRQIQNHSIHCADIALRG